MASGTSGLALLCPLACMATPNRSVKMMVLTGITVSLQLSKLRPLRFNTSTLAPSLLRNASMRYAPPSEEQRDPWLAAHCFSSHFPLPARRIHRGCAGPAIVQHRHVQAVAALAQHRSIS